METYLEYLAVALGVLYVLLASKGNIWCWPLGIIGSGLYIFINLQHYLFQDAILQSYYVFAGFYGWWKWNKKEHHQEWDIIRFSLSKNVWLIVAGASLVPLFGYIFARLGNSLSYYDSTVTVFSFIATWMTARKVLENWIYWIAIDAIAAVMYAVKGLYPTTALYVFFCLVAVYGYTEWRKQFQIEQKAAA